MKTHDIGRAFWCVLGLTDEAPFAHRAPMFQAVWPYKQGKTVIFKFGGKGLCLGWWSPPDPKLQEEQLLLAALRGHPEGSWGDVKATFKAENYREAKLTFTHEEDAEKLLIAQAERDAMEKI